MKECLVADALLIVACVVLGFVLGRMLVPSGVCESRAPGADSPCAPCQFNVHVPGSRKKGGSMK